MRRRLMMRTGSNGFVPFPIPNTDWTLNTQISSSGQVQSGSSYTFSALSTFYPVNPGDKFMRTSENTDSNNNQVTIWIHELRAQSTSSNQWIKRTVLVKGSEYTIGSGCTYIRFACAYPVALGLKMTQTIINQCFAVSKKEV